MMNMALGMFYGMSVFMLPLVKEFGWTWPSIQDPERRLSKQLGSDYQPYVAVIDADGNIVATFDGGGDEATWEALVERLPD